LFFFIAQAATFCPLKTFSFLSAKPSQPLLMTGSFVYNRLMSDRTAATKRRERIRNLIALGVACVITLLVMQFMAAFNGVMKVINQITTNMAMQCPKGYDLVTNADGSYGCTPQPPPIVPGLVSVTLLPLSDKPAAPAPATKPSPATTAPSKQ
jgi:hypothetical protein